MLDSIVLNTNDAFSSLDVLESQIVPKKSASRKRLWLGPWRRTLVKSAPCVRSPCRSARATARGSHSSSNFADLQANAVLGSPMRFHAGA